MNIFLLWLLISIPIAYFVWNFYWKYYVLPNVEIEVDSIKASLALGETTSITVHLRNRSWAPAPYVKCKMKLPDGIRLKGSDETIAIKQNQCEVNVSIMGNQEVRLTIPIEGIQRGVHVISSATLIMTNGLSFKTHAVFLSIDRKIVVHPRRINSSTKQLIRTQQIGALSLPKRNYAVSQDWITIRPYEVGDSVRDIAWYLSARRDEAYILQRSVAILAKTIVIINLQTDDVVWKVNTRLAERIYEVSYQVLETLMRAEMTIEVMTNAHEVEVSQTAKQQRKLISQRTFQGPVTKKSIRQVGHWLGQLSVHAKYSFDQMRIKLPKWSTVSVVVITAFSQPMDEKWTKQLRKQGCMVEFIHVGENE